MYINLAGSVSQAVDRSTNVVGRGLLKPTGLHGYVYLSIFFHASRKSLQGIRVSVLCQRVERDHSRALPRSIILATHPRLLLQQNASDADNDVRARNSQYSDST